MCFQLNEKLVEQLFTKLTAVPNKKLDKNFLNLAKALMKKQTPFQVGCHCVVEMN